MAVEESDTTVDSDVIDIRFAVDMHVHMIAVVIVWKALACGSRSPHASVNVLPWPPWSSDLNPIEYV